MVHPQASPLAVYTSHLAAGRLAYQFDPVARRAVFHPRVVAPGTGHAKLEWRVSAGKGRVYATTFIQPRGQSAYNVALIDVDEGFRMMSRVEGIDAQDVRIGMRVRLRIVDGTDGGDPLPVFVPAEGEE